MASAKCNDILSRVQQAKGAIDTGFEQLGRIKGLYQQATTFQELDELQSRRSEATVLVNRQGGNTLAVLLQEAQNNNCGPEVERRINVELNYAREVGRQLNTLGGDIASKQMQIQSGQQAQQKAKEDAATAQATQKATTTQDNAGNGKPGTAGTSSTANDLQEVTVTGKKTPATVNEPGTTPANSLDEVSVTGKRNPDALEEVQVTGVRNPNELEEVQVTGKPNTNAGLQGQKQNARAQATIQDTTNFEQAQDWRVRLRLSPGADYLYKAPESQQGILKYLNETDGVVFPYTPTISVSYAANYDQINPTHSNYKVLQYSNSSVDNVSISCDFTAQDTREANYLLAVIHFFRSVTKMFYGQDQNPKPGTPPPLVYLFGLGEFQFNAHPMVVTNFNYALPSDVDYIRAGAVTANPGVSRQPSKPTNPSSTTALDRLKQGAAQIGQNFLNSILPGGESAPPSFTPAGFSTITPAGTTEPTYVPTKINLQIQCMPIVSRNDVSNRFSLAEYASGKLLRGTREKGGGFW